MPSAEGFDFVSMRIFTHITLLFIAVMLTPMSAHGATATFVQPATITPSDINALSTSGDNAGFTIGLGETLALLLSQPIGAVAGVNDRVSIFSVATPGLARATIRIGAYNNGSPQFAVSRNFRDGQNRNVGNLFNRGCGILGGCDYIEIITNRVRRGSQGTQVDYIVVNGEVVQVTSPTPEPATWMMMIAGFVIVAARLKQQRASAKKHKTENGLSGELAL